LFCFLENLSFY
jgi:hypothetical protein